MNARLGDALIVAAVVVLLATGLVLRRRLPAAMGFALCGAAGAALGAGTLLVQEHASAADWAIVVPLMALLAPAHIRIVFGPFGPPGPAPATGATGTADGGSTTIPAG